MFVFLDCRKWLSAEFKQSFSTCELNFYALFIFADNEYIRIVGKVVRKKVKNKETKFMS